MCLFLVSSTVSAVSNVTSTISAINNLYDVITGSPICFLYCVFCFYFLVLSQL